MKVRIGGILHSYTGGRAELEADGPTLGAVLDALERGSPGLKFRIVDEQGGVRPNIALFVGGRRTRNLATAVGRDDEVSILGALSGG